MTNSLQEPKIVLVPYKLYGALDLALENPATLLDFKALTDLIGFAGVANFVYLNSLYNLASGKFSQDELIKGLELVNLLDIYRDQALADPSLGDGYAAMTKRLEALQLTKEKIDEEYVFQTVEESLESIKEDLTGETVRPPKNSNNMTNDTERKGGYYVPVLFSVTSGVYGVRLEAYTGLCMEEAFKQATVANIQLLGKTYTSSQLVQLEYFKEYLLVS